MDELLAYAILLFNGFPVENAYEKKLDELFLQEPDNADFLELEWLGSHIRESVGYILQHMDYNALDRQKFGKTLMQLLKEYYNSMDIRKFGDCMYNLWEGLPGNIQDEEPFLTLCFADDPLSWGDTDQVRKTYEKMLAFYDE